MLRNASIAKNYKSRDFVSGQPLRSGLNAISPQIGYPAEEPSSVLSLQAEIDAIFVLGLQRPGMLTRLREALILAAMLTGWTEVSQ